MFYFASDIHLGAGTPAEQRETERVFIRWLDHISADAEAVFLLGDLFDFWFEYRRVAPQGCVRALGKLAELTDRGIRVVLFTGNHDMWVGDYLARECGVELHTAPGEVTLAGKRLFLAHGDNMNIRRQPMLRLMNTLFRSRTLRFLFSWLVHPDMAMKFGRWWSGKSRKSHGQHPPTAAITEPLRDYARQYAERHPEVDLFIFGHMHVACDRTGERPRVLHLGSWERTPTYAVLDDAGILTLKTFTR